MNKRRPNGQTHQDEVRKIAEVARIFNRACGIYFSENPDVPQKLKTRISDDEQQDLEYHAQELAQWADAPQNNPQRELGVARASLAFCDLFAAIIYKSDMNAPFEGMIPESMRTDENVKLCRKLGLDHFALLCRPQ